VEVQQLKNGGRNNFQNGEHEKMHINNLLDGKKANDNLGRIK
jgi:hypothetical protein